MYCSNCGGYRYDAIDGCSYCGKAGEEVRLIITANYSLSEFRKQKIIITDQELFSEPASNQEGPWPCHICGQDHNDPTDHPDPDVHICTRCR
ncbi:MAG: hypothetical protein CO133_00450 [Candidatus Komeilibacteria bacterium CG_4_9_14_3_um_filter_37_5]|nr:MAG: hypothetical protein CO133_00450 [Candidatus Komeilibacteria bacterium CG_4_9_14_3_um_filter_37_5]